MLAKSPKHKNKTAAAEWNLRAINKLPNKISRRVNDWRWFYQSQQRYQCYAPPIYWSAVSPISAKCNLEKFPRFRRISMILCRNFRQHDLPNGLSFSAEFLDVLDDVFVVFEDYSSYQGLVFGCRNGRQGSQQERQWWSDVSWYFPCIILYGF